MSAPKAKAPKFHETYESRMISEIAQRLVELEEHFRDHLLDCEATPSGNRVTDPAAAFRKTPRDLPITLVECELCRDGIPHSTGPDCDTARRDMARCGGLPLIPRRPAPVPDPASGTAGRELPGLLKWSSSCLAVVVRCGRSPGP